MKVIDQPYTVYCYIGTVTTEQHDCNSDCVELLVQSGADVHTFNSSGDTALNLASQNRTSLNTSKSY